MRSDPRANGAEDNSALALDQLVAEELSALRVTATEPIEHQLTDFAERLCASGSRSTGRAASGPRAGAARAGGAAGARR